MPSISQRCGRLLFVLFLWYLAGGLKYMLLFFDVGRGVGVRACDCKRDRLWVQFLLEEMKYLMFLLVALVFRHSIPEFSGKWGVMSFNTRFSLPNLLLLWNRKNNALDIFSIRLIYSIFHNYHSFSHIAWLAEIFLYRSPY